jgi:4-amino-4-deoxy-L-arabinose transferase-like glycosyltransferase
VQQAEATAQPFTEQRAHTGDLLLIAFVGIVTLLPFLGQLRDISSHEIRHAQIAREMAERRDFLVPTLLGNEYREKPPVMHAAVAALYRVAGEPSLLLARVPSVVAGIIGALVLYGIGLALHSRRAALLAALGALAVPGYSHMARIARPDMIFAMAILLACLGFLLSMRSTLTQRRVAWLALAGFGTGLAILCKGPLGLIFPLMFAALAPIRRNDLRRTSVVEWIVFLILALVTLSLWAVPVYLRDDGGYLHRVIFQPDITGDSDVRSHPMYWYLTYVVTGFLPLTLLLPLVVADVRRRRYTAAAAVALVMFVLLSFVAKKRPHYLLPIYPFLALAVAEAVVNFSDRRLLWRSSQVLVACGLIGGPIYYGIIQPRMRPAEEAELSFARRVVAEARPGAKIVCAGVIAEPVAFLARQQHVTQANDAAELLRQLREAGQGSYLVLSDQRRAMMLGRFAEKLVLTALLNAEVPSGRTVEHWTLYRVDEIRP